MEQEGTNQSNYDEKTLVQNKSKFIAIEFFCNTMKIICLLYCSKTIPEPFLPFENTCEHLISLGCLFFVLGWNV